VSLKAGGTVDNCQ